VNSGGSFGGTVRGERTADVVARRLGQAILNGELAPGTRLREETLAKTFSVSRTPVREALILLSASGLADLEPNRGATVLQLTAEDVTEVYHLRAVLESESAALAARRSTPEVAGLLLKICDRMGELHGSPAAEQLAADTRFHYTIAEASGSRRLHALVRQVSAIPEAFRSGTPYSPGDMTEAERQHRAIAQAIGQGRHGEARRLMRSHVGWAGRLAVERLEPNLAASQEH
jgi:DNA-binding GntR family transcriptional regulator